MQSLVRVRYLKIWEIYLENQTYEEIQIVGTLNVEHA